MGDSIAYRSDIDGLRAVAVMPILLFHAGLDRLAGGFVGVDVFYVISGYLITSIIVRELGRDEFSIAGFYRRRAVRILPALFAMLLATLIASFFVQFPTERRHLLESMTATIGFSSNIYFWLSAGYFSSDAEFMPLLHTWSLGVEEQYYLFYPLILIAVARWNRRALLPVIAAISAASFALSWVTSHTSLWSDFAFYMLPSRAWELGIGALAALAPQWKTPRWVDQGAAAFGLALIGLATLKTHIEPFPAPWALPACLGAGLIVRFGRATLAGTLLSWAPVRWVGRISYSIYLWHWPVISLYRFHQLPKSPALSNTETIVLTLVSIAIGALSFYWIEQPFLKRFRKAPVRPVLVTAAACLIGMLTVSAASYATAGRINAFPPAATKVNDYLDYRRGKDFAAQFRYGSCFVEDGMRIDRRRCVALSSARPNIVIAGDSTVADLRGAIDKRWQSSAAISQLSSSNCHPVRGGKGSGECTQWLAWLFDHVVGSGRIDMMILGGIWKPEEVDPLIKTIGFLRSRNIRVVVLGPPLLYERPVPLVAGHAIAAGEPLAVDRFRAPGMKELSDSMARRVRAAGAEFVDVYDLECLRMPCDPIDASGEPKLFDGVHVTPLVADRIVAALPGLASGPAAKPH